MILNATQSGETMNPESELKTCGRIACKDKHCHHQPLTAVEAREERNLALFSDPQALHKENLSANKRQVGGDHYITQPIQPWDYIHRNGIGFLAGSAIKYLSRYKQKDGVQDLEKAKHFLEKLIEEEQGHEANPEAAYPKHFIK